MWAALLALLPLSDVPIKPAMVADLAPVMEAYDDMWHVSVPVYRLDCGMVNAWYNTLTDSVVLCNETLAAGPAVARFILAHEMAHVAMWHAGFDLGEAGADELATLMELQIERDDVREFAEFLMADGLQDSSPDDPAHHPRNLQRARMLLCLDDGYDAHPVDGGCEFYEVRSVAIWQALLRDGLARKDGEDGASSNTAK